MGDAILAGVPTSHDGGRIVLFLSDFMVSPRRRGGKGYFYLSLYFRSVNIGSVHAQYVCTRAVKAIVFCKRGIEHRVERHTTCSLPVSRSNMTPCGKERKAHAYAYASAFPCMQIPNKPSPYTTVILSGLLVIDTLIQLLMTKK